jgi:hypothetical protein
MDDILVKVKRKEFLQLLHDVIKAAVVTLFLLC